MRIATLADRGEMYLREIGYGMLDVGTCGADPDDGVDGPDAVGALGAALHQRLAERGVL